LKQEWIGWIEMLKKEWVYREILYRKLEGGENFFKQKRISGQCGISIGNVNKSLEPLERMNCIEKKPMGFVVINPKKILLYWASIRNLERDIIYQTHVNKPVEEIEKELPPVLFTAYSGYKFRFKTIPSDYSEVLVYGEPEKIQGRFKKTQRKPNLIVLKPDKHLLKFKQVPIAQIWVDLWNLNTWYANEFVKSLEKKGVV
jgi:hypothetical protein